MSHMNPYFESIIEVQIRDRIASSLPEPALVGLDDETQIKAKSAIVMWQLEYECFHLKLKDFVDPLSWMEELDEQQMLQVAEYISNSALDSKHYIVLNWYPREHRFRLERSLSPVASR